MSITKILQGINRCEVEYTDGWWETESGATFGRGKLIEAQGYECGLLQRITELEAQLADENQVANDCRIVADNAIAEALGAKKDAERYQWLRRTAVELSLSHQVISQFVTNQGELDAAIQAEGKKHDYYY